MITAMARNNRASSMAIKLLRLQQLQQQRYYASSSLIASAGSGSGNSDDEYFGDVIQGPSLLRTKHSLINRPNPSLLYYPGLRSLPYWSKYDHKTTTTRIAYQEPKITEVVNHLEANFQTIKDEYLEIASTLPSDYNYKTNGNETSNKGTSDNSTTGSESDTSSAGAAGEHKLHQGSWEWHSYMTKGILQGHFGQYFPKTTSVLQELRGNQNEKLMLFEGLPFGYCFFSTLGGKSVIESHTAPMNLRLRIHLPLIVPEEDGNDTTSACGIRVGAVATPWREGKALVFDDSFDHEVWNHTSKNRVLLLLDMWHPDITMQEKVDILQMFQQHKDNERQQQQASLRQASLNIK